MASSSETGHAINISNFKLVIDKCFSFGVAYNPTNPSLSVANMTALWHVGDTAQTTLNSALMHSKEPINQRQILVDPINKLVTKTLNYYISSGASAQSIADAKAVADDIRGANVKVIRLPDGTVDPAHVSTSHLSFVKKQENLAKLAELYHNSPLYDPNELDIKLSVIVTLSLAFKAKNDGIGLIIAPVDTARIARNHALYDETTGILDQAALAKKYVRGLYGPTSEEAGLVTQYQFKKPKRMPA